MNRTLALCRAVLQKEQVVPDGSPAPGNDSGGAVDQWPVNYGIARANGQSGDNTGIGVDLVPAVEELFQ